MARKEVENNTDKYPGLEALGSGNNQVKKRTDRGESCKEGSYEKKGGQ